MQVLGWCGKAGLVKLGRFTREGTKIKANASKDKLATSAESRSGGVDPGDKRPGITGLRVRVPDMHALVDYRR